MTYETIDRALRAVEQKGEMFSAGTRLLTSGILLVAGSLSSNEQHGSHILMMIGILYGVISVPGVILAIRRFYNPLISYLYVFVDMLAVAGALTMLARMHEIDATHELSLPIFTLSFVVLIHAALRYRPELLLFGAISFIFLLIIFPMFIIFIMHTSASSSMSHHHTTLDRLTVIPHDVGLLPLIFLLLSGILLFYIIKRTRNLVGLALVDERRATQLQRFFSPEVARDLVSDEAGNLPTGHRQSVAIIFIDIRGFSSHSEKLTPEELAELLSSFRSAVCDTIFKYGGTVDKFIGDAVLAVFGTPAAQPDDAFRALSATFELRRSISHWQKERARVGKPSVSAGIGAHFGDVFAGVIESGRIMEHTVIGSAVNIAQRIERLTREHNSDIAFSDQLLIASGIATSEVDVQERDDVMLAGHSQPFKIWFSGARLEA